MSRELKAVLPILYRSVQYRVGDRLPADNEGTVAAWIEAGSAAWIDSEEKIPAAKTAKAKSATAPLGKRGASSDGDPEARVGRVPDTPEREKPKKGRGKK